MNYIITPLGPRDFRIEFLRQSGTVIRELTDYRATEAAAKELAEEQSSKLGKAAAVVAVAGMENDGKESGNEIL
jgi:hypothetical protein